MVEMQNLEGFLTNIMFLAIFRAFILFELNINLVTHKKISAVVQTDLRLSHKLTFYTNTDDLKFAAIF